jgi:pSer/pThr/pTyr-binding forkhead associated (FHA) protein
MLQAVLRVLSGRQNGAFIPLPVGKFLIGREEDCQLRPNSELVSRHHCVFTNDDFTLRLRDLGSTNGTFVNGERLRGGPCSSRATRSPSARLNLKF